MFRPIPISLVLGVAVASVTPAQGQVNQAEQQACFDRRVDELADLDSRIAACFYVIGDTVLGVDVRAEAHLRRASAYVQKAGQSKRQEDVDRAIADLSEAARLARDQPAVKKKAHQCAPRCIFTLATMIVRSPNTPL
jgi:hypothetical protein